MEVSLTPADAASPDDLQQQIRRGFDACRAAVEAELAFERRLTAAQAGLACAARCERATNRRATPAQVVLSMRSGDGAGSTSTASWRSGTTDADSTS